MKDYDKNKESSYLKCWDVYNLYGWAMLQKLPVNNFEWIEYNSQFNEDFIKNYKKERDEGYFFKVDFQYPEKSREFHNDLPFLPERMKIEKVKKLVTNLHDKTEYVIRIRNLQQALNHGLTLFFLSGFSFTTIHNSQDCKGRGRAFLLTPHDHFHPLRRHLDISRAITAESSPLHIASRRTRTGELWFPSASR